MTWLVSGEHGDLRKRYLALPWRGKLAVAWRLWRDRRAPLRAQLLLPAVASTWRCR